MMFMASENARSKAGYLLRKSLCRGTTTSTSAEVQTRTKTPSSSSNGNAVSHHSTPKLDELLARLRELRGRRRFKEYYEEDLNNIFNTIHEEKEEEEDAHLQEKEDGRRMSCVNESEIRKMMKKQVGFESCDPPRLSLDGKRNELQMQMRMYKMQKMMSAVAGNNNNNPPQQQKEVKQFRAAQQGGEESEGKFCRAGLIPRLMGLETMPVVHHRPKPNPKAAPPSIKKKHKDNCIVSHGKGSSSSNPYKSPKKGKEKVTAHCHSRTHYAHGRTSCSPAETRTTNRRNVSPRLATYRSC